MVQVRVLAVDKERVRSPDAREELRIFQDISAYVRIFHDISGYFRISEELRRNTRMIFQNISGFFC